MNIYVGNLTPDTTEDEVRQAFESFGEISSVKIIRDGTTGESRGFGFIEMSSEDQAKAAIEGMNGKELKGNATARGGRPGEGGRCPVLAAAAGVPAAIARAAAAAGPAGGRVAVGPAGGSVAVAVAAAADEAAIEEIGDRIGADPATDKHE